MTEVAASSRRRARAARSWRILSTCIQNAACFLASRCGKGASRSESGRAPAGTARSPGPRPGPALEYSWSLALELAIIDVRADHSSTTATMFMAMPGLVLVSNLD